MHSGKSTTGDEEFSSRWKSVRCRPPRRQHVRDNMSPITVTTVTLLILVVASQAQPSNHDNSATSSFMDYFRAPQRRNTKSMSFMDYFFPTFSRNPKTSDNLTNQTLSTSPPTSSSLSSSSSTIDEARATKTTKRKTSINTTPKTTKKVVTSASSRLQESTTEKLATPDVAAQRVTLADLAKVSESTATERSTLSTAETASTQPDGREGELELKEKSQVNHKIKITDQTKKEVGLFFLHR